MEKNIHPFTLVNTILIGIIFLSLVGVLDISTEKKKLTTPTTFIYPERDIIIKKSLHDIVPYYNQPIRPVHPRRHLRPHFRHLVKNPRNFKIVAKKRIQ
tara:strand:+ start:510 stop:806 length:297 start_codon:yes stop_codon:yes gene_type:complete